LYLKVIAVTGMPGSGKEEFVSVAIEMGISVLRMGDVVREYVRKQGLELTDDNIGRVANKERKEHGLGIWAERTVPQVSGEKVLIDGIRGGAELEVFRNAFGDDIITIGIHCSPKTRYKRIVKRKRSDATLTWEAFIGRDRRELAWGIGKAIASSDHMIINEGTLAEFKKSVKEILGIL
jgi:dephospho-CoA kinase